MNASIYMARERCCYPHLATAISQSRAGPQTPGVRNRKVTSRKTNEQNQNQQSTGEIATCSAYTNETASVRIPRRSSTAGPPKDCLYSAHHVIAAVQAFRDKVNNTLLIDLIQKGSHRVVSSKKSGILVSNMLKCRAFENHVLLVPPPVLTPGAQTFMAWDRIRPMASHVTG